MSDAVSNKKKNLFCQKGKPSAVPKNNNNKNETYTHIGAPVPSAIFVNESWKFLRHSAIFVLKKYNSTELANKPLVISTLSKKRSIQKSLRQYYQLFF